MKKVLKIAWNVLFWVGITIICAALIVFIIGAKSGDSSASVFGYRCYTVLTNSMSPTIKAGDIVFVDTTVDKENLSAGDIVTFYPPVEDSTVVTHRVVSKAVSYMTGTTSYTTKGDANTSEDLASVESDQVVGVVKLTIPKVGKLIRFIKNNPLISALLTAIVIAIIVLLRIVFRNRKKRKKVINNEI